MKWATGVTAGSSSAKAVLLALAYRHQEDTGLCFPSVEDITRITELNFKTIRAALHNLREAGLIDFNPNTKRHRKYILNFEFQSSKNGPLKPGGQSSNFGGLGEGENEGKPRSKSSKSGRIETDSNDPKTDTQSSNIGLLEEISNRPKTEFQSSKNGHLIVQNWSTKGIERDLIGYNPSCHDSKNEKYLKPAHAMWEKIQPLTKQTKPPNFQTWANDLRLLVENDNRTPEEVWRVFLWANNHPFWQTNILCPAKLRKQFGALFAKMSQEATNGPNRETTGRDQQPRRLSAVERVKQARYGNPT